ncbi:hypothetical protein [Endozoicomonas sp. 8E]
MKLNTVLHYNLKSVRAYLLREDFQVFWATSHHTGQESFWIGGV